MTAAQTPVALKRAPAVEVQLPAEKGFAPYLLAFDFKAICAVKSVTGKSLLNSTVWETMEDDPELVSCILWAGLQLYQPALPLDDVQHMLLPSQLGQVLPKIREAGTAVQPKAEPDPKPELVREPVPVP